MTDKTNLRKGKEVNTWSSDDLAAVAPRHIPLQESLLLQDLGLEPWEGPLWSPSSAILRRCPKDLNLDNQRISAFLVLNTGLFRQISVAN